MSKKKFLKKNVKKKIFEKKCQKKNFGSDPKSKMSKSKSKFFRHQKKFFVINPHFCIFFDFYDFYTKMAGAQQQVTPAAELRALALSVTRVDERHVWLR